ncbi:MAG TPA: outer membrane beta-barrel protein [Allosphingosinicella sp.]|nr:outer membrane beta-barrel protein [Allosphingosinicella sp.]
MKSRWIIACAALAAPGIASAQTRDDPRNDWSGFYVGADVGLASGRIKASGADEIFQLTNINPPGTQPLTVVPGTTISYAGSRRHSDILYGGTAGFLVQTGNLVLGVEGDAHGPRDAARYSGNFGLPATALAPPGTVTIARDARVDWDWSARGRVGVSLGSDMIYADGGIASARIRLRGQDTLMIPAGNAAPTAGSPPFATPTIGPVTISASRRGTMTGWTAGIGGEHRLASHLSLGLDARYSDYGHHNYDLGSCVPNTACGNATVTGGTITFPAGTNPASISLNSTDAYPGASPGVTRVSLNEWRISARLIFRF